MSVFSEIEQASPIEVFKLIAQFKEDPHPNKVNLSVGAYRTEDGKPWVLPVVRTAEAQMASDQTLNHEYLPVAGLEDFRNAAVRLLLGETSKHLTENRVGGIEALGGTGALRLCAEFLKKNLGYDTVYVSNPTWGNHKGIFKSAGFANIKEYRYWDAATKGLNITGMLEDLNGAPPKSVVILHAVAHNPTGVDATEEQWHQIAQVCREKAIFVVMDNAYQGFITGDVDADAWSSRYFVDQGFEFFVAQSFSKNFGLYNERVGNVTVVCNDEKTKTRVCSQMELLVRTMWSNPPSHGARIVATVLNNPTMREEWDAKTKSCLGKDKVTGVCNDEKTKMRVCSQMELLVRTMWSNPPSHGARIVATVLNNPTMREEWKGYIKQMADRIKDMRQKLYQKLRETKCPGNWDHIVNQKGMFSYTGLNEQQSLELLKKYHIYIMKSGRINMCGLNLSNMEYVANAITEVVSNEQQSLELLKKYHIYIMKSGRINMCGLNLSNMEYVANAITEVVSNGEQQQKA